MNGRTYPMTGEKPNKPFAPLVTPTGVVTARIQVLEGGYIQNGAICVFTLKYKALKTASNSPSLLNGLPAAVTEAAVSIVDITSGITTAVGDSVPGGISTNGTLWVQSIVTDHIYSIAGSYITP